MTPAASASLLNEASALVKGLLTTLSEGRENGLSDAVIKSRMATDLGTGGLGRGDLVKAVQAKVAASQQKFYTDANSTVILEGQDPSQALFMWNALGSLTCPDCTDRHGQVKTFARWQSLGLPRLGSTVCKSNCRCGLVPEKVAGKMYGVDSPEQLTSTAREAIDTRTAQVKAEQVAKGKSLAPSTEADKVGNFRQPLASDVKSATTAPTSSGRTVSANLADDAFRAQGRDPRSLTSVSTSDYSKELARQRRARVAAIDAGELTDVETLFAESPLHDRSATIQTSGSAKGRIATISEGTGSIRQADGSLKLPTAQLRIPKGNKYTAVHNHPEGLPLSGTDLKQFTATSNLSQVRALAPNNTYWQLSKKAGVAYDSAVIETRYAEIVIAETEAAQGIAAADRGSVIGQRSMARLADEFDFELIQVIL